MFQEKCPLGCPCDNYDCVLPERKAILTLNTRTSSHSPVLIQPNGELIFIYDKAQYDKAKYDFNMAK